MKFLFGSLVIYRGCDMYQQEMKFFWPLTEQIPLDLDYSVCEKPKLSTTISSGLTNISFDINGTMNSTITAAHIKLDVDTTTIKLKKKPNPLRCIFYRILGLKWELK